MCAGERGGSEALKGFGVDWKRLVRLILDCPYSVEIQFHK